MIPKTSFSVSLLGRPAWQRLLGALAILACLWLAILWAVVLP
ncbi:MULTISPECIES: hypothetical protein [Pseudooceanicola]|nr:MULTISPECIES: hypothetical protein [Pseudooceanicola]